MALKTYNPKTPSQRHLVTVDRSELWKGKPVKKLTEGRNHSGGRNNAWPDHVAGSAAAATSRRYRMWTSSAPSTTRRRRWSGWNMTRTDRRLLRWSNTTTANCPIFSRRSGCAPATRWSLATGRHQARQLDAAAQHAAGHHRPQCRDEAGQRRADRALRRNLRAAGRPRPGLRAAAHVLGRAAPGAQRLLVQFFCNNSQCNVCFVYLVVVSAVRRVIWHVRASHCCRACVQIVAACRFVVSRPV